LFISPTGQATIWGPADHGHPHGVCTRLPVSVLCRHQEGASRRARV